MKNEVALAYTAALSVMLFLLNTAYLSLQAAGSVWFALAVLATVTVAVATIARWFRPGPRRQTEVRGDRVNFVWIVVFEAAAMGAGNSYVLRHDLDPGWMVVWSTLVVAVHFAIMGWSKRSSVYYVIGLVIAVGVMGGVLVDATNDAGAGRAALAAVPITVLFVTLATTIGYSDVRGRLSQGTVLKASVQKAD